MNMKKNDLILSVKNLVVKFKTKTGIINAVRDVSFSVYKGEIVGLPIAEVLSHKRKVDYDLYEEAIGLRVYDKDVSK